MTTVTAPTAKKARFTVVELRTAHGWTQAELARRAGVASSTITALEAHKHDTSVSTAIMLARALGVRVEDIDWGERAHPTHGRRGRTARSLPPVNPAAAALLLARASEPS